MRYEGDIYSPHIAGDDYILQCTIGCSHNKCTFCYMYKNKKYRVRALPEILQDISLAKEHYGDLKKVFLADGDALSMPTEELIKILGALYNAFPGLSYVGVYASATSILNKTVAELTELKKHGLIEAHLGVESGDKEILKDIQKGVSQTEMIEAGRRIKQAGIALFITVILGLAGKSPKAWDHAKNTAQICNEIQPDSIGVLTLIVQAGTEIYEKTQKGEFTIPEDIEILKEMCLLLEGIQVEHSGFTSIHPSNYIHVDGMLPEDQEEFIRMLTEIINKKDTSKLCARAMERV